MGKSGRMRRVRFEKKAEARQEKREQAGKKGRRAVSCACACRVVAEGGGASELFTLQDGRHACCKWIKFERKEENGGRRRQQKGGQEEEG